jgi:hypothetical protein
VRKFEAGAFDDDARAADLLQDYEAKIAALYGTPCFVLGHHSVHLALSS